MSIQELTAVIPPPNQPSEAGKPQNWLAIQKALGLKLPDDLRDFGMRYETGRFNRSMTGLQLD